MIGRGFPWCFGIAEVGEKLLEFAPVFAKVVVSVAVVLALPTERDYMVYDHVETLTATAGCELFLGN